MTNLHLVNRWLALAGGVLSCALSFYIWLIVGEARALSDLFLALAQCSLVAIGGYLAVSIFLRAGLAQKFGLIALLLPASLWAVTFWSLIPVALGYWSKNPMLMFELMLPVQITLLALGGAIFGIINMLSRYLINVRPAQGSPMPPLAPSDHQQPTDWIFAGLACVCCLVIPVSVGVGLFSLQHLLQPADAVLFGPTPDGQLMVLVPIIVISLPVSFWIAWILSRRIRRSLRKPYIPLIPAESWAKSKNWQTINWSLVAVIAGVILMLVETKGFGSYFYVTESGVSIRPPAEFSMRHYEWKDVTTVKVHCIRSIVKRENRFRYILKMSDGYEVDLSNALSAITEKQRAASAALFAENITAHLSTVPGILYQFDVSEEGLAVLGEKRGMVLPNAIREQVLSHGGTLQ